MTFVEPLFGASNEEEDHISSFGAFQDIVSSHDWRTRRKTRGGSRSRLGLVEFRSYNALTCIQGGLDWSPPKRISK